MEVPGSTLWRPLYLDGVDVFVPSQEVPLNRSEYIKTVDPDLLASEIDRIKRTCGDVPDGVEDVVLPHLGRLNLLHTLGGVVLQSSDPVEFRKYYEAMTHAQKLEPAGLLGKRGETDRKKYMDAYPDAFRRVDIELGLVIVAGGFAINNLRGDPEHNETLARYIAEIDIRRKKNLVNHGAVAPGLPETRAFIQRIDDGYEPGSELLSPLAAAMREQLGDNAKKIRKLPENKSISGDEIKDIVDNLDLDDPRELEQVESAIIGRPLIAKKKILREAGMKLAFRMLDKAAASGQDNARFLKNRLLEHVSVPKEEMLLKAFIRLSNEITKAKKSRGKGTLLEDADISVLTGSHDLPRAIDRIMYVAFDFLEGTDEASKHQKAGNIAGLLAVMGINNVESGETSQENQPITRKVLSASDIAIRYWNYPKDIRERLVVDASQGMDDTVLHEKLRKILRLETTK